MPTPLQNLGGDDVVSFVDFPVTNDSSYSYSSPGQRFFQGFEWRFLFTDLDTVTKTWATGLLTDRQIVFTLNDPTVITAGVHPDDFRVNGLRDDGYPRISQSNTLVYCFRREGGTPPWKCKAAGILMSPEDEGDADSALSHFTAYDARKLLAARPVMNSLGELPGSDGFVYLNVAGSAIALDVLKNSTDWIDGGDGSRLHIDAGVASGGTAFWSGTIETTDSLVFTVQQGQSVADVWDQLNEEGNCDIVLNAIYDPVNRPGYTHELSIYKLAGIERPGVLFAWDMLNRSVAHASRVHDGTPGAFFNTVQYYAGQGGPPIPLAGPLVNAASVAAFGPYWSQQFWPAQTSTDPTGAATLALAAQALVLAKQGKRTYTIEPVTERAPVALLAYGLGDRVQVRNSARMRVAASGLQRVQALSIALDDNGVEKVNPLLCSPDWDTTREA